MSVPPHEDARQRFIVSKGREPCARCEALLAGADLLPPLEITKPAAAGSGDDTTEGTTA